MRELGSPVSEADLHAFVDGHVAPANRGAIIAYLGRRPDQTARVLGWKRNGDALREAFAEAPAKSSSPRTGAALVALRREAVTPREGPPPRNSPARPVTRPNPQLPKAQKGKPQPLGLRVKRRGGALLVVAFGLLAGAATLTLAARSLSTAPIWPAARQVPTEARLPASTLAARTADMHRAMALDARRMPASETALPERLRNWLASPASASLRAPGGADLRAPGGAERFDFVGARGLAGEGPEARALVYQNTQGQRVSLALARVNGVAASASRAEADGALQTVSWTDANVTFALAATMEPDRLARLARVLYADIEASGPR